ncbi:MAG: DUF6428 family protein [Verrucomicrobiales bacterium]
MTLKELKTHLASAPGKLVQLILPGGSAIPQHFHVTEVGQVQKDFIDCGGDVRKSTVCLIQAWVANDVDHRIETDKLLKILNLANKVIPSDDIPVEFEYQERVISQYPLKTSGITDDREAVTLTLGLKFTDCLSKDTCGIPEDYVDERQFAEAAAAPCCGPGETCGPDSGASRDFQVSPAAAPIKFG